MDKTRWLKLLENLLPSGSDDAARAALNEKIPFKVKAREGELNLESNVAKGNAELRDIDTVDLLDPEMVEHLEKLGAERPAYISSLEANKGYGVKALAQLEASAKKRGADSAYLNASPLGGTRGLSQLEAAEKVRKFYEKNGYTVAEDMGTNAMMMKKLGIGAGATLLGATALGGNEAEAAPLLKARQLAEEYAKLKGLNVGSQAADATVNVDRAKRIAEAFENMKHDPSDPAVKTAYDALINETTDQYKLLKEAGLKTSKITSEMGNPYKTSADMIKDVTENNHLYYYPTESGFGGGGITDHPLLQKVDVNGEQMPANDVFRIVHDYFGHAKEGTTFGPKGEENAWRQHMQMYTPEAQKALTTETRGQNSWVNYGPKGEANRANPAETVYAEQKAGLLPDWAYDQSFAAKNKAPSVSDISPFGGIGRAYNLYDENVQKPVSEVASSISSKILDMTTPIQGDPRKQFIEQNKPILDTATELAIDPLNYVPLGRFGNLVRKLK